MVSNGSESHSSEVMYRWQRALSKTSLRRLTAQHSLKVHFGNLQARLDEWNEMQTLVNLMSQYSSSNTQEKEYTDQDFRKLKETVLKKLNSLDAIEGYYAYPGPELHRELMSLFKEESYQRLDRVVSDIAISLATHKYRCRLGKSGSEAFLTEKQMDSFHVSGNHSKYFEVLVVSDMVHHELDGLRKQLNLMQSKKDPFNYDFVFGASFDDAVAAVIFNPNIQVAVLGQGISLRSTQNLNFVSCVIPPFIAKSNYFREDPLEVSIHLAEVIKSIRPSIDIYLFTKLNVEQVALTRNQFRRVFYSHFGDINELHLTIVEGVNNRFNTPFFNALKEYSTHPTGVFHALPISRGNSLARSHWIRDMWDFYGKNIFMAETSATCGGLDSLLDPHGPIKRAQELAAETFGAARTYWVTNGTSTANKIVMQAICRPGDIVLIDRNCHKSHHYSMCLLGASVVYLDAYPLEDYAMYGAVPLEHIKRCLLRFRAEGRLDKVKVILLTNCTFDGIVYNVRQFMEEALAIKPDLIFLWDEAWWAFAYFHPLTRNRSAMHVASLLIKKYKSKDYHQQYLTWKQKMDAGMVGLSDDEKDEFLISTPLMPDPTRVRVRVYATQSTHKTLTCLRQGSMIHLRDQDFNRLVERPFCEAYFTHTSTSPNYQILASLDVGRRQVALEGYEFVQKQIEKALITRERVEHHPRICRFFRMLNIKQLIPARFRSTTFETLSPEAEGMSVDWVRMYDAWRTDEFVLDPCRLTLMTGLSGIDGDTFKQKYLMDQFEIQVNKTSINTVLFMTTIGTSRSAVASLLEALCHISDQIQNTRDELSAAEDRIWSTRVKRLTENMPPLPNFSHFHRRFRLSDSTPEACLRDAFFLAYDEENCGYIPLADQRLSDVSGQSTEFVCANFVIPYPPGFPILVPGQVITQATIDFFRALDVKEVHGYDPELGIRVFLDQVLQK